jgi:hypothetical protein
MMEAPSGMIRNSTLFWRLSSTEEEPVLVSLKSAPNSSLYRLVKGLAWTVSGRAKATAANNRMRDDMLIESEQVGHSDHEEHDRSFQALLESPTVTFPLI